MKCTDNEWKHCRVEKMGCDGCYYNQKENKLKRFKIIANSKQMKEQLKEKAKCTGVVSMADYDYIRVDIVKSKTEEKEKQYIQEFIESLDKGNILELLADNEHRRWASWQKYVHSKGIKNEDGSLTIPKGFVNHWEYEINADYSDLEENIKESDRIEVRKIIELIKRSYDENI